MPQRPIVYFAGALKGDRRTANEMREMIRFIQSSGLTVLTEHIAAADHREAFAKKYGKPKRSLTPRDIESQDLAWLDQASHMVAEVSGASTGTGREIEYARLKGRLGKTPAQILCLYRHDLETQVSWMVTGMTPDRYPNVRVVSYRNLSEARSLIQNFLFPK